MGGVFSTQLKNKKKVSFIINYSIYPQTNKNIKVSTKNVSKSFINRILSTYGENYKNSVSHYSTFKTNKIIISGIIKLNMKKIEKNNIHFTEYDYKNHIKNTIVKSTQSSFPIKLNKKHQLIFENITDVVFK
jgi:hypothetical protein